MATDLTEKAPFILKHPKITIGSATPGPVIELQCFANELHTNVDQADTTVETFCGSYTSYKPEVWDITLAALQSYGVDGLWNQLRPLVGTVQPFTVLPDGDAAVGPDNPEMSGDCLVKAFPFVDGVVGESSAFDLVLSVQGPPEWDTTGTTTQAAAADTQTAAADAKPAEKAPAMS
jgi:hypothetical protein